MAYATLLVHPTIRSCFSSRHQSWITGLAPWLFRSVGSATDGELGDAVEHVVPAGRQVVACSEVAGAVDYRDTGARCLDVGRRCCQCDPGVRKTALGDHGVALSDQECVGCDDVLVARRLLVDPGTADTVLDPHVVVLSGRDRDASTTHLDVARNIGDLGPTGSQAGLGVGVIADTLDQKVAAGVELVDVVALGIPRSVHAVVGIQRVCRVAVQDLGTSDLDVDGVCGDGHPGTVECTLSVDRRALTDHEQIVRQRDLIDVTGFVHPGAAQAVLGVQRTAAQVGDPVARSPHATGGVGGQRRPGIAETGLAEQVAALTGKQQVGVRRVSRRHRATTTTGEIGRGACLVSAALG